ncbi:hypothetical protein SpCBS45565_g06379 [Spizellomyces sp. 'palustris']|nr:hypothetical protein SpCBS45565_g06379 [Spizellomyces sp. 'palustris']
MSRIPQSESPAYSTSEPPAFDIYDQDDDVRLLSSSSDKDLTTYIPSVMEDVKLQPQVVDEQSGKFAFVHKYKDLGVGAIFMMQLVAATAINAVGIVNFTGSNISMFPMTDSNTPQYPEGKIHPTSYILPIIFVLSVALCLVLFTALRKNAQATTYAALLTPVVLLVLTGAAVLPFHGPLGVVFLIPGLVLGYLIHIWRNRIGFAVAMLETITTVIKLYPSMYAASVLALLAQLAYLAFTIAGFIGFFFYRLRKLEWEVDANGNIVGVDIDVAPGTDVALAFLFVSGYWTLQFIPNALQVILSGVFASHYFAGDVQPGPLRGAAHRALTTSFGPIAFGSFVILIAQAIYSCVLSVTRCNPLMHACCQCGLGFVLSFLEYFNKYAFAQVAIYGKDYVSAAKDTWNLFKSSGVTLIINDNLVNFVMGSLACTVALISGYLGAFLAFISIPDYRSYSSCADPEACENQSAAISAEITTIGLACALIGAVIMQILIKVIDAGVATTFVVVAEDRQVLKKGFPSFYEKLKSVYPQVTENWTEDGL